MPFAGPSKQRDRGRLPGTRRRARPGPQARAGDVGGRARVSDDKPGEGGREARQRVSLHFYHPLAKSVLRRGAERQLRR